MNKDIRFAAVILAGALLLIASVSMLSAENQFTPAEQVGVSVRADKQRCDPLPPFPDPLDADMVALGEALYFDQRLSEPNGQACADCHLPEAGFDDPDDDMPVSQGVLPENRWGNRNSPMSAYAMYAPMFHYDGELWVGGQFWDGRATGQVLGDPLADQALGPFLNPLEMNNPVKRTVVVDVMISDYGDLFEDVWGDGCLKDVENAYDRIAFSIAAFERSALFAAFDSTYDSYLQVCLGLGGDPDDCARGIGDEAAAAAAEVLTEQEWYGLQLFMNEENNNDGILDPGEGAMCVACHVADWTYEDDYALPVWIPDWTPDGMVPPLFTDFTFDNLGTPKNPDNPFYHLPPNLNPDGEDWVDYGLGGVLNEPDEMGKHKVMTLRNIGMTAPYLHNGVFDTLLDVVHFYNTRDNPDFVWPEPEVPMNVNESELGNLGLSPEDEEAVAAFMMTLTDVYGSEAGIR